jgi:hypothetical protein
MSVTSGHSGAVLAMNTETPRILRDPKRDIHIIPEKMIKKKDTRRSVGSTTINANNLIINIS